MSDVVPQPPCPVCDGPVPIEASAVVSELIRCRACGTELEVTAVSPPAVAEAPTEEEDWGQ